MLNQILEKSETDKNIHIIFYSEVYEMIASEKMNAVEFMKILLVLHFYINKASKYGLLVYNFKNHDENLVEAIINLIQKKYKGEYSIIEDYAELIKKKF